MGVVKLFIKIINLLIIVHYSRELLRAYYFAYCIICTEITLTSLRVLTLFGTINMVSIAMRKVCLLISNKFSVIMYKSVNDYASDGKVSSYRTPTLSMSSLNEVFPVVPRS